MRTSAWMCVVVIACATAAMAGSATAENSAVPVPSSPAVEFRGLDLPETSFDADDEQHMQRLRAHLGLAADADLVHELMTGEHPDARWYEDLYGLVMTPDEVDSVLETRKVMDRLDEVAEWAAEAYGDAITDVGFLQLSTGPGFLIRAAQPITEAPVRPKRLADLRIVTKRAPRSSKDLAADQLAVERALMARGVTPTLTRPDPASGTVVVEVEADDLEAARRLVEGNVVIKEGIPLQEQINKDQALPYLVVEAGQQIESTIPPPNNPFPELPNECNSAFAVQNGYGPFVLTSEHCKSIDGRWSQGGGVLGIDAASSVAMDAKLISTASHGRNARGRIHISTNDDYSPVHFLTNLPNWSYGHVVCQSGYATTGLNGLQNPTSKCGVVFGTSYSPSGRGPYFAVADYRNAYGDSGAAVYRNTGFGRSAEGIHHGCVPGPSGCLTNPYYAVYTYLPNVMYMWGLQLTPPGP